MVRPILFMICVAVLYCLTLFIVSILLFPSEYSTPSTALEISSVNQKHHHSSVPIQTAQTSYLNLNPTHQRPKSSPTVPTSEILIESTVFSSTVVTFEVKNPNFFYISSKIFIEPNDEVLNNASKCILTSSQDIINPVASKEIGHFECRFLKNGEFAYIAYIVSNYEVVDVVRISIRVSGPQLELIQVNSVESGYSSKFQIKNVGDSSITVAGLFFQGLSCFDQNLEIIDCGYSFDLLPAQYSFVEIKTSLESVAIFTKKNILVKTSLGDIKTELEICSFPTHKQPSFVFIIVSIVLLFINFYKTIVPRYIKKVISSKIQEEVPLCIVKNYSKVMIPKPIKLQVESIEIFSKKYNSSDQFTMASETTDTHLNSPTNSLNSEELSVDDDYFLDTYKTTGLFCRNTLSSYLIHLN